MLSALLLVAGIAAGECTGDGADNPSTTDYLATHTTYTSATGTISASSERALNEVWRIADDLANLEGWSANSPTASATYALASARIFNKYTVEARSGGGFIPARCPKDWTIRGSNDNFVADDNVLDTVTGETGWQDGVPRTYTFVNTTQYSHYRIDVTLNNGDASFMDIGEIELIESQCA